MTEMTERERAVETAAMACSGLSTGEWFCRMLDAARGYDAAQKPAETAASAEAFCAMCGAPTRSSITEGKAEAAPSDPVATVREAMKRLDKSGTTYAFPGARWKADVGAWMPVDTTTHVAASDAALATILNTLEKSPLLERARRDGVKWTEIISTVGHEAERRGVIKGLEMAAAGMKRAHDAWAQFQSGDNRAEMAERLRHEFQTAADRIRSGGEIDGETGGTTSGPGACPGQDRGLTAPEGQTQAGGAPGLPKGWIDVSAWTHGDGCSPLALHAWQYNGVLRMARAAIKLRAAYAEAIAEPNNSKARAILGRALSSLGADHG